MKSLSGLVRGLFGFIDSLILFVNFHNFAHGKYPLSSEFLAALRETLKSCMAVDDTILVVSYDRKVLSQTGAGRCYSHLSTVFSVSVRKIKALLG